MSEPRPLRCGILVDGGPCMRTPGHSGTHLPGTALKMALNSQYGKDPATEHLIRSRFESFSPGDLFTSKRAYWIAVSAGAVLWLLICFQLFVDVYVLAVR